MTSHRPVFRFAPSPNGALHLGHAYSALVTAAMAKAYDGRLLLRIEDIDEERCRPEFERQILDDLAWLGLEWEEPVRRQSEHMGLYRQGVGRLDELGVLYPCFATRREISEAVAASGQPSEACDPDGSPLYPGLSRGMAADEIARRKAAGEPYALRLDMEKALQIVAEKVDEPLTFQAFGGEGFEPRIAVDPRRWGDVVIARKQAATSYHLSVVMDDAEQGVTHVTRGEDLLASSDVHRLLQVLLGLDEPLYHHHRLITDEAGRKLSKSHKDLSLAQLRRDGAEIGDIRRMTGFEGAI